MNPCRRYEFLMWLCSFASKGNPKPSCSRFFHLLLDLSIWGMMDVFIFDAPFSERSWLFASMLLLHDYVCEGWCNLQLALIKWTSFLLSSW